MKKWWGTLGFELFAHVFGIENKFAGSKLERGQELLRISGIDASETVIVGDTLHDLEVAKDLGVDAVLIAQGHQSAGRLRKHHSLVIEMSTTTPA